MRLFNVLLVEATIAIRLSNCAPLDQQSPCRTVLLENRFVDVANGAIIDTVASASRYWPAIPIAGQPGLFLLDTLEVDTRSRKARRIPYVTMTSTSVTLHNKDSDSLWTKHLSWYVGGVRPPHALVLADHVLVSHTDGVTALSRASGDSIWHISGPSHRLHARDDLLIAGICGRPLSHDQYIMGVRVSSGSEAFRVPIPFGSELERIVEVGRLFLIRGHLYREWRDYSFLIDETGAVQHNLESFVSSAIPVDDDVVLMARDRIVRRDRLDSVVWESKEIDARDEGGGLIRLDGGDLVCFSYGVIHDSGVLVARLRAEDGSMVWRAQCAELGVPHSAYWHLVYLVPCDGQIIVVSQAAGGDFIETLDGASGQSVNRVVLQ